MTRTLLLVFLGGGLGSALRQTLLLIIPETATTLSLAAINISGSLLLGLLTGNIEAATTQNRVAEGRRLFLGVGMLGGFTSYSAFIALTHTLTSKTPAAALLTSVALQVLLPLISGTVFAYLGYRFTTRKTGKTGT